jgi:hypothetical protein
LLESFLWGAGGSAAVEILIALRLYESEAPTPVRYSKPGFWVSRALVAVIAGGLVVAHHITGQPLLSIHIGVATPAIFAGLAEEIRHASRRPAA